MRTDRYRELLPVDRLAQTACTIIGVGAIGRQVALQLAAMGVGSVQLIDFDTVETVNLGPQAYLEEDVGKPKVEATAELMQQLNRQLKVERVQGRFNRRTPVAPVVFCCVDSIQTRRHVWAAVHDQCELFIDGRMAAEVLRVIAVGNKAAREHYPETLFSETEAFRDGCTARSTIYCANVAAGIMVSQFTHWLRGLRLECDVMLNLLAMEVAVDDR